MCLQGGKGGGTITGNIKERMICACESQAKWKNHIWKVRTNLLITSVLLDVGLTPVYCLWIIRSIEGAKTQSNSGQEDFVIAYRPPFGLVSNSERFQRFPIILSIDQPGSQVTNQTYRNFHLQKFNAFSLTFQKPSWLTDQQCGCMSLPSPLLKRLILF